MALCPVNTNEDHRTSLLVIDRAGGIQQHANGSVLIGTPSHQPSRLPRPPGGGTIYRWTLVLSNREVLTHRRLGHSLAYATGPKPLAMEKFWSFRRSSAGRAGIPAAKGCHSEPDYPAFTQH